MTPFRDRRPVTEGEFPTGTELMLWRPGINRNRLRERAFNAAMFSSPATCVLLGTTLIAMGALPQKTGWVAKIVTILIVAGYALVVWVTFWCADHDHQHSPNKPCFLDETRGEYYFHRGDFDDLPPPAMYTACVIITTVRGICTSPATTWLDPRHLREIHQVAWDALQALEKIRDLRKLVEDPRYQAIANDLADAQACLSVVDDTLDDVVDYLQQVMLLIQAWEQKLTEADLRSRLHAEVDNIPTSSLASTHHRAESVTEGVFAYVTAARDVTNAGSFVWERALP